MYEFKGIKIDKDKTEKILEIFKMKYINESYPERILLLNHLNRIDRTISIEEIRKLKIPVKLDLFLYHERLKTLYRTNFKEICLYVEQLEPWEDIDCLVFDDNIEWFIGITHNDTVLITGII